MRGACRPAAPSLWLALIGKSLPTGQTPKITGGRLIGQYDLKIRCAPVPPPG